MHVPRNTSTYGTLYEAASCRNSRIRSKEVPVILVRILFLRKTIRNKREMHRDEDLDETYHKADGASSPIHKIEGRRQKERKEKECEVV
jgi:hypothetical protein